MIHVVYQIIHASHFGIRLQKLTCPLQKKRIFFELLTLYRR
jgi:hypothetical protein